MKTVFSVEVDGVRWLIRGAKGRDGRPIDSRQWIGEMAYVVENSETGLRREIVCAGLRGLVENLGVKSMAREEAYATSMAADRKGSGAAQQSTQLAGMPFAGPSHERFGAGASR